MKKLFYSIVVCLAAMATAQAQTTPVQAKSTTPKTVDKDVKKLEKKTSKAETLMEREQEEKKTEEQAKPNPMKSKGTDKALNPQPFPPAEAPSKKVQNSKVKN